MAAAYCWGWVPKKDMFILWSHKKNTAMAQPAVMDPRATVLGEFIDLMAQFLSALKDVFPECPAIASLKTLFDFKMGQQPRQRRAAATEGIQDWFRHMSPWFEACRRFDERVFSADIPLMTQLKIREKLSPELHPETKEAVWEYLQKLNDLSNMYHMYDTVPSGMMGNIQAMASDIATKIQAGEMAFSDLNLMKLGEQVAARVDPNDLRAFTESVSSGPGGSGAMVTNLYSAMSTMMPGVPK